MPPKAVYAITRRTNQARSASEGARTLSGYGFTTPNVILALKDIHGHIAPRIAPGSSSKASSTSFKLSSTSVLEFS